MPIVNSNIIWRTDFSAEVKIMGYGTILVEQIREYNGRELDPNGLCFRWRFADERPFDAEPTPRNPWQGWYLSVGACVDAVYDPFANGEELPALYELDCTFQSISTADYVLDHCNGDDEQLIGVPVYAGMTMQDLSSSLLGEWHDLDKLPDDITEEQFIEAVNQEFAGKDMKTPFDEEDAPAAGSDSDVQAWFRFYWVKV